MLLNDLPQDLRSRYEALQKSYKAFHTDLVDYQTSLLPRYVSIPQYFSELGLTATYNDMKKLAELARRASVRYAKPIRTGATEIGQLFCFYEEILDECFDTMTLEDEDEE